MARWTRRELNEGASLCLELGAGLLENGAETSRVEESIRLAAAALGSTAETMVTPTGITVCFGREETITRVLRIKERTINLDKVASLNSLSRGLDRQHLDLSRVRGRVEKIRRRESTYTWWQQFSATALVCACFALSLGGGPWEALFSITAGCLGKVFFDRFGSGFPSFLSLFFVGFLSTVLGLVAYVLVDGQTEAVVVGSLLHRMPGLAIVAAAKDLMSGELVAGVARASEALVVTLGMASGVLACLGMAVRVGLGGAV